MLLKFQYADDLLLKVLDTSGPPMRQPTILIPLLLCRPFLHLQSRVVRITPHWVRPSLLDLDFMEDRVGVQRETCSHLLLIALVKCFQIRKTVDTHAGLSGAGVIRWLAVSGAA